MPLLQSNQIVKDRSRPKGPPVRLAMNGGDTEACPVSPRAIALDDSTHFSTAVKCCFRNNLRRFFPCREAGRFARRTSTGKAVILKTTSRKSSGPVTFF
jgi:hypothetical protein